MKKLLTAVGLAAALLATPALAAGSGKLTDAPAVGVSAKDASTKDDAGSQLKDKFKADWEKLKVGQKDQRDKLKLEQKDQRDKLRVEQKDQRDKLKAAQKDQWHKFRGQQAEADDVAPATGKRVSSR